ncbi:MAG: nuclear transport factor 2 family protein [Chloroflexota bacterium]
MIGYADAGAWLEAYRAARETFDGDGWVALFTDDAEYHGDPFGEPLVGHNALRAFLLESAEAQRDVDFTVERHWVSGSTVLAAWHASWAGRTDGRLVRSAGFMTADIADDGRASDFHAWSVPAPSDA